MSTFIAVLCFFFSLYLTVLAFKDSYVSDAMHRLYGSAFGNPASLFWVRCVVAAIVAAAGIWLWRL